QGQGQAEGHGLALFVEHVQRRFGVTRGCLREGLGEQARHVLLFRHGTGGARIQQLVQQQRVLGQSLGQQGAARRYVHQPRQRRRLFLQQRQVGGAAGDGLQQRQRARHGGIGRGAAGGGGKQFRQHLVQTLAATLRERAHRRRGGEFAQGLVQAF